MVTLLPGRVTHGSLAGAHHSLASWFRWQIGILVAFTVAVGMLWYLPLPKPVAFALVVGVIVLLAAMGLSGIIGAVLLSKVSVLLRARVPMSSALPLVMILPVANLAAALVGLRAVRDRFHATGIRATLFSVDTQDLARLTGSVCTACAYDLTGNTTGICPECGATFEHRASRNAARG